MQVLPTVPTRPPSFRVQATRRATLDGAAQQLLTLSCLQHTQHAALVRTQCAAASGLGLVATTWSQEVPCTQALEAVSHSVSRADAAWHCTLRLTGSAASPDLEPSPRSRLVPVLPRGCLAPCPASCRSRWRPCRSPTASCTSSTRSSTTAPTATRASCSYRCSSAPPHHPHPLPVR